MADKNAEFLQRLLETFKVEACEHINAIAAGLGELERAEGATRAALVETVFREAHSLKAAARAVSQRQIEQVCQSVEGVFAALKRGEAAVSRALHDALYMAVDALSDLLAGLEASRAAPDDGRAAQIAEALERAFAGSVSEAPQPRPVDALPATGARDTVRLPARRLEALLRQAEEILSVKLAAQRQAGALVEVVAGVAEWRGEASRARSAAANLRHAPLAQPVLEFLERGESRIAALEASLRGLGAAAAAEARSTGLRVDRLLQDFKQVLMMECGALLESLPRAARELARDQGKEVELVIEGGELQIDRRVLDGLKEPLLHMVRNCIDHGIERPAERRASGKPERARIRLAVARRDSDKIELVVADDGAGIALDKLRAAAVKNGLLSAERVAAAGEAELLSLVFHSGLTTSPMLTDVSGRGLGLAIARERVERLGGSIAVESCKGEGTTFRLVVPHTLATFRGVLVSAAGRLFVIPTLGVERVLRRRPEEVRSIEGRAVLEAGGAHLPLVALADVLRVPGAEDAPEAGHEVVAVVAGAGARRTALRVDEVHGDQEVLVKPLGRFLEHVRGVSGACVLADGRIAPILNVHELVRLAVLAKPALAAAAVPAPEATPRKSILVVEDSITARGLLKDILEAAGYHVKTAVDGVDAWTALKLETFDLVLSDVEMPRMNGFDLTVRIRADAQLAELPVVLVTALASREDRERGVEAGANAYIVKGDFDQERLLEVLRRFA